MSVSIESCYECGHAIPDGLSEPARVCLGILPGDIQYWAWVDICPDCVQRLGMRRRLWMSLVFVLVVVLTFTVAYPLLP
jgi:hypothetical protein